MPPGFAGGYLIKVTEQQSYRVKIFSRRFADIRADTRRVQHKILCKSIRSENILKNKRDQN